MEKPNVRFHDGQILSEEPLNKAMEAVDAAVDAANAAESATATAQGSATAAQESASAAQSAATTTQGYVQEIKEAMQNLPDGSAVSAQVATNKADISQLALNIGKIVNVIGSQNVVSRVPLSVSKGTKITITNKTGAASSFYGYNSSNERVDELSFQNGETKTITTTDDYVAVGGYTTGKYTFDIEFFGIKKEIEEINNSIDGKIVNVIGSQNVVSRVPLSVSKGTKITITNKTGAASSFYGYNSSNERVDELSFQNGETKTITTTDDYVAVGGYTTGKYTFDICFVGINQNIKELNNFALSTNNDINYLKEITKNNDLKTADNWESGSISLSGANYASAEWIRTKNVIKVKKGTIIIPYVFGKYMIAFYDDNGNFIERLPEDGGGQHKNGVFSQNAYEFTEDANVRFIVGWMTEANFYTRPGFENIIPNDNSIEHIIEKFVIVNNPSLEYNIKHAVDSKVEDIFLTGDVFKATFITDVHEYFYHEYAARYCAELTSDVLINGGDLLSWPTSTTKDAFATVGRHVQVLAGCSVPVIMARGNHEMSADYYPLTDGSQANMYSALRYDGQAQRPFRNANYIYNESDKKGYFYYDDEQHKVRVICLNLYIDGAIHRVGDAQRTWLANVALDLSSKGNDESNWSVMAVGHSQLLDYVDPDEDYATMEERWIADVFKACYNKAQTVFIAAPEGANQPNYTTWSSMKPDFRNNKYKFVGYFCGHSHYDNVTKVKDFPHVTTTCAHPLENCDKYRREWGTATEYAFDVICLDTSNRKIILKRVGVGADREVSY